ncbi:MAG: ribosome biogenesis GTP-binding protein YihA/YsxC [Clostridiales bacterium]
MLNSKHECTAVSPTQYPKKEFPEIVLLGRSNVGKSSFINSMLNRKNLARIGSKPGKTRVINFYNINENMFFVDLPGYGYAKVSKSSRNEWQKWIEEYLITRNQIKMLILLVDIRHEPSNDDKIMYNWIMSRNVNHLIVANKFDKITKSQLKDKLLILRRGFAINEDVMLIPYSAKTKFGTTEVWNYIEKGIE